MLARRTNDLHLSAAIALGAAGHGVAALPVFLLGMLAARLWRDLGFEDAVAAQDVGFDPHVRIGLVAGDGGAVSRPRTSAW